MSELRNLKTKDIPDLRKQILIEQNYRCPLCGNAITEDDRITLDHQHKYRKSDENGIDGNGLVRGVLCADCNVIEGKLFNSMARFLRQPSTQQRIEWVKNLLRYYEKEPYPYVHPSEVAKDPPLSKRNFNKLNKLYFADCGKTLEYPKSAKMTKPLSVLYEKYDIEPYN